MSRISETFSYSDLNNGIYTPLEDVIVEDTVALSNPTIKYKLIDLDEDRTQRLGQPCYKRVLFETEFKDELTIAYQTYDSSRKSLDQSRLQLDDNRLSFNKISNKSSVVDDDERDNIDFRQVGDIEPLLARYLSLQQFSGKRLVSLYVIARALDDYFKNHWGEIDASLARGYVEPKIPWLRMNISTGDRLEINDGALNLITANKTSALYPIDPILTQTIEETITDLSRLVSLQDMSKLVDLINTNYGKLKWETDIVRGTSFDIVDGVLAISIDGIMTKVDWYNVSQKLFNESLEVKKRISEVGSLAVGIGSYEDLQRLLDNTFISGDSKLSYTFDSYNGNILRSNGNVIRFLGELAEEQVNSELAKFEEIKIVDSDRAVIERARAISKVHVSSAGYIPLNKTATSIDAMLEFLA